MNFGKSIFKNLYKAHIYAGIFVAIHFAIFSVSGLVLLFREEIQDSPTSKILAPKKDKSEIARGYETVLANAIKKYPNGKPLGLFPDENDENILNVLLGIGGTTNLRDAKRTLFNIDSGEEIVEKPSSSSGFFEWFLFLHRELFLGSGGKLYVGFVGLIYVFMLLSGFFIYGKFTKGRSLGDIRQARIPKLVDLHKFVGIITFGWSLVIGLSGVFLAFDGLLIALFQYRSLSHLSQQYQGVQDSTEKTAPFSKVVETALDAKANSVISYISFPDAAEYGVPGHYLILINGTDIVTKRIRDIIIVNSKTASLSEVVDLPLYLKAVFLSGPLHAGNYGGIFLKIIWAIFTICSLAVACFGITSFFTKRKNRKTKTTLPLSAKETRQHLQVFNRSPYRIPTLLAATTALGVICALFTAGIIAQISIVVLLIPLLFVVFGRKKNG